MLDEIKHFRIMVLEGDEAFEFLCGSLEEKRTEGNRSVTHTHFDRLTSISEPIHSIIFVVVVDAADSWRSMDDRGQKLTKSLNEVIFHKVIDSV